MTKRFLLFAVIIALVFSSGIIAFAQNGADVSDWTNLKGYTYYLFEEDSVRHPAKITETSNGLNYKCDGYYKVGVKEYSGIVLKEKVNPQSFSIEFTVNKPGGDEAYGDDCWIGIGLLDKPNCWDTYSGAQAAGLINLLRPNTKDVNVQLYEFTQDSTDFNACCKEALDDKNVKPKGNYKVEIKKEGTAFYYYINGVKKTPAFKKLDFLGSSCYLYFSTSTNAGEMWDITITKINGKALGTGTSNSTIIHSQINNSMNTSKSNSSKISTTSANVSVSTQSGSRTNSQASQSASSPTASQSTVSVGSTAGITDKLKVSSDEENIQIDYTNKKFILKKEIQIRELLKKLTIADECTLKFYDIAENELDNSKTALNGMTIKFIEGETVLDSFEVVIDETMTVSRAASISSTTGGQASNSWLWVVVIAVVLVAGGALTAILIMKARKS